jgi:hypothetical protein
MNVYTATTDISVTGLCLSIHSGDVIGKLEDSIGTVVNGTSYSSKAFWLWVGSVDSLNYLTFFGNTSDPSSGGGVGGTVALQVGEDYFEVSGQTWGFVPTSIVVSVWKPNGGDNLFATVRQSSITDTGFIVDLQAPAGSGYFLSYVVVQ